MATNRKEIQNHYILRELDLTRSHLRMADQLSNSMTQASQMYSKGAQRLYKRQQMIRASTQNLKQASYDVSKQILERASTFRETTRTVKMRGKQLSMKIAEKGNQIGSVLIQLNRRSWAAFRTMQVYFKFISGYPRMVYIPVLLLTCTAYGFHSVKRSTIPRQIISPSAEETSLTDLASLKNWVIANSVSAVTDILAGPEV